MENSLVRVLVIFLREENASLYLPCDVVSFVAYTKVLYRS